MGRVCLRVHPRVIFGVSLKVFVWVFVGGIPKSLAHKAEKRNAELLGDRTASIPLTHTINKDPKAAWGGWGAQTHICRTRCEASPCGESSLCGDGEL